MTKYLFSDVGLRSTASSGFSITPKLAGIAMTLNVALGLCSMPESNNIELIQNAYLTKFSYEGIESPLSSLGMNYGVKSLSYKSFGLEAMDDNIFDLDSIDADIDHFMASLDHTTIDAYSDELIAFAEQLIEENPQAFKSFL